MKLPFNFGTKLLFRLVLPGLMLSLVVAPGAHSIVTTVSDSSVNPLSYLPFLVVFLGWLISLCDMPIYMLYEGRRFWPRSAFRWGMNRQRKRLERLRKEAETARDSHDLQKYTETSIEVSRFPLDAVGEPDVQLPTRLGNLIYEYELYPKIKYGLDSVFFFYRIWVSVDDDLRTEMDNQQATVDGSIYISFVLVLSSFFFLTYGAIQLLTPVIFPWIGPWWANFAAAAGSSLAAYCVYRISLYAHAQYGEFYKAFFDQHRSKLETEDVLKYIVEATGDAGIASLDTKQANMAVWRYLRWHKVRPTGSDENENFEALVKGVEEQAAAGSPSVLLSAQERQLKLRAGGEKG